MHCLRCFIAKSSFNSKRCCQRRSMQGTASSWARGGYPAFYERVTGRPCFSSVGRVVRQRAFQECNKWPRSPPSSSVWPFAAALPRHYLDAC